MRGPLGHWDTTQGNYADDSGDYCANTIMWHGVEGFIEAEVELKERTTRDEAGRVIKRTHELIIKNSPAVKVTRKDLMFPTRDEARKLEVIVTEGEAV